MQREVCCCCDSQQLMCAENLSCMCTENVSCMCTDIEIQANEILHHKLTLNGYLAEFTGQSMDTITQVRPVLFAVISGKEEVGRRPFELHVMDQIGMVACCCEQPKTEEHCYFCLLRKP